MTTRQDFSAMVLCEPSDRFGDDDEQGSLRDRIILEAGATFTLDRANATDFDDPPDHFSDAGTALYLSVTDGGIVLNDPPKRRFGTHDGITFDRAMPFRGEGYHDENDDWFTEGNGQMYDGRIFYLSDTALAGSYHVAPWNEPFGRHLPFVPPAGENRIADHPCPQDVARGSDRSMHAFFRMEMAGEGTTVCIRSRAPREWQALGDFQPQPSFVAPLDPVRLAIAGPDPMIHGGEETRAGGGADRIEGHGGAESLLGSRGGDTLLGNGGPDRLDGADGPDRLAGGVGADRASGRPGGDTLLGGPGADALAGGPGDDRILGRGGNDTLAGEGGGDTLAGGAGADVHLGGTGPDLILGGPGADVLSGGADDDVLAGGRGADLLEGGAGADRLAGADGGDVLFAGEGEDTVRGGAGEDRLVGGAGADRVSGGAGDDEAGGGDGRDRLYGGEGHDLLSGDRGGDRLAGGPGDDVLSGGRGNDVLSGGTGRDVFVLSPGADLFRDFLPGEDFVDIGALGGAVDAAGFLAGLVPDGEGYRFDFPGGSVVLAMDAASRAALTEADVLSGSRPPAPADPLAASLFLDMTSWRLADYDGTTTVREAWSLPRSAVEPRPDDAFTLALTLPRANDAADLLALDWGARQETIAVLSETGLLWALYGADPDEYEAAVAALEGHGARVLGGEDGLSAGPETRTIFVEMDGAAFESAFGTPLFRVDPDRPGGGWFFWNGPLSPDGFRLDGVMPFSAPLPASEDLAGVAVALSDGPQGVGNASPSRTASPPQDLAAHYRFPFLAEAAVDGTLALVETGVGASLSPGDGRTFEEALHAYLTDVGVPAAVSTYEVAPRGTAYGEDVAGERSLDASIVAAVNPYARVGLYAGLADPSDPDAAQFTTYYDIVWDRTNDPEVVSSSFVDLAIHAPGSPFQRALDALFVDAALRNMSVVIANGDGGSGDLLPSGLTNVFAGPGNHTLQVGGTSLTTALQDDDPTLAPLFPALDAPAVVWQLVAGGLNHLPDPAAPDDRVVLETVWNSYDLDDGEVAYGVNAATSGGVDVASPVPGYQRAFGLAPEAADPAGGTGRAMPDVTAVSFGNSGYLVADGPLRQLTPDGGGTSASAPLWASLLLQVNTVFEAVGLPRLGFANDLLYETAAVMPAAFNDVTVGNNVSSFRRGEDYTTPYFEGDLAIDATGCGYRAAPGFDLTSGLGSPDGTVLARAMATVGLAEIHGDRTGLLAQTAAGPASAADQAVIVQRAAPPVAPALVETRPGTLAVEAEAGGHFAWTARFAQKALAEDFDPALVRLFDGYAQPGAAAVDLSEGQTAPARLAARLGEPFRAGLTDDAGFVSFRNEAGRETTIARLTSEAVTPFAADGAEADVRLRQTGEDPLAVAFYRVDDHLGTVDGIAPGEAGYAAAAAARRYDTASGERWIDGAGDGLFSADAILGVDRGDILAMAFRNGGEVAFVFPAAGEAPRAAPVWSYGLDTWGFEADGDRDYNDLVVQLDYVSPAVEDFIA